MSFWRKTLYAVGAFAVLGTIGVAATVASVEKFCVADGQTPTIASDFAITDSGYVRQQGDSFLTFPEWYIVHAYNDLAGVTAKASESDFDYLASIRGFWSSLCGATRQASTSGPASADQKATNYIIGFSFTFEMALQGAYERSIGALSEWTTGGRKTAEDEFNLALLKDYGAFLYQTPWYQFPFGARLRQFWRETPFIPSIRSAERRGALSLQYAGRAGYAAAMRFIAGYDPADLTIQSVVGGLPASELRAIGGVKVIREVTAADGERGVLVETARYAAFDAFVRELTHHSGAALLEIAGNHRILITVILPEADSPAGKQAGLAASGAAPIFNLGIQSSPGQRRVGVDTPVRALVNDVGRIEAAGYRFEHAYDY
ncbi:MAG TPA: hypothetical protein VKY22_00965 [Bradyrhizobium sp.]|nr:hypothetical protein [Bradyrhizobium sp.]